MQQPLQPRAYDSLGKEVRLGKILGYGGEGNVHEVVGDASVAAKIYHNLPEPAKARKLSLMTRTTALSDLNKISAWPVGTLHKFPNGPVLGFLMPRIANSEETHVLYSPAQRKLKFPQADWSFLVHTARNLAAAFATFHSTGNIVVGDVNPKNILISHKAEVTFIDCDSLQFSANGDDYLCEVGFPECTPPELQRDSFKDLPRTQNHDDFGLAVLCFHLLFMGRHPFVGRFHGQGDMPIEKAIREYRFAFGTSVRSRQMSPPPDSLGLDCLPNQIATLFERAFSLERARAGSRPSAIQWVNALEALEKNLARCADDSGHKYYRSLARCPWCTIESKGGPAFFIVIVARDAGATDFDLKSIWSQITSFISSPPTDALPIFSPLAFTGPPYESRHRMAIFRWLLLPLFSKSYRTEHRKRREVLRTAEVTLGEAEAKWKREVGGLVKDFDIRRKEASQANLDYESLVANYESELQKLRIGLVESQRIGYLRRFFSRMPKYPT